MYTTPPAILAFVETDPATPETLALTPEVSNFSLADYDKTDALAPATEYMLDALCFIIP